MNEQTEEQIVGTMELNEIPQEVKDKVDSFIKSQESKTQEERMEELENNYPFYNRRNKGWKLIDMLPTKKPVPVYQYMWPEKSKYSGEKLRQLRAERGVGSSKKRKKYLLDNPVQA